MHRHQNLPSWVLVLNVRKIRSILHEHGAATADLHGPIAVGQDTARTIIELVVTFDVEPYGLTVFRVMADIEDAVSAVTGFECSVTSPAEPWAFAEPAHRVPLLFDVRVPRMKLLTAPISGDACPSTPRPPPSPS